MGHRKTASLHIRFDNLGQIDDLEIWANQRGEKLIPWARQALLKQAREENFDERMTRHVKVAALENLALNREMAGTEASLRAQDHVKSIISKVRSNVEK